MVLLALVVGCGQEEQRTSTRGSSTRTREVSEESEKRAAPAWYEPKLDAEEGVSVEFSIGRRKVARSEFEQLLGQIDITPGSTNHGHGHAKVDCSDRHPNNRNVEPCVSGEYPVFSIEWQAIDRRTGEQYVYSRRDATKPGSPVTTHRLQLRSDRHAKVMRPKRE
jgi:hypothetical protein